MKEEQIIKSNFEQSSLLFKNDILLNEDRITLLKELSAKNNLSSKKELRPIAWRIFFETIPSESKKNNLIKDWIDIIYQQREEYKKKLEKYCSLKKFGYGDPLLKNENGENNDSLYNEEEKNVLNLINLDLQRTHQALELFQTTKTKNILSNVLFIYAKEYWGDIPYGQGMNELLSMIYICLYPYYFNNNLENKNEKITKENLYEYLNDINKYYKEIYLFFHDETQIQSDLFYLFESLEKKGINDLYQRFDIKKSDPNYNLYELFPDIFKDHSDEDRTNHLNLRAYNIFKEKLKLIDNKLFNYLKRINVKCNYFMHRWLKCIFSREFEVDEVLSLWDKIFFYEFNSSKKYKYSLIYIDFICVAMLVNIRYELFKKNDDSDCYTLIFHYPKQENITIILELADKISEIIQKKLIGDIYDINEVIRMIKKGNNYNEIEQENDSDVNEELIIKPHMYNQQSKLNYITCDKKREIVIFFGKYIIKIKLLVILLFCLIIFLILIFLYKNFIMDSE